MKAGGHLRERPRIVGIQYTLLRASAGEKYSTYFAKTVKPQPARLPISHM